jgi:heme/copper-type cytochrome/quinol oxidase subunit 2
MPEEFNPFQSPQILEPSQPRQYERGVVPFESGRTRAVWAMTLLGVMVLLNVIAFSGNWLQYDLLDQIKHGTRFSRETLESNDHRQAVVNMSNGAGLIVTAICFLMWTHRAYRNLPALGAKHLEHSPGSSVGWYFVPVANLMKPYAITTEIWRHSDPDGIGVAARASSTGLVVYWWLAYIAAGIAGIVAGSMAPTAPGSDAINRLMTSTTVMMVTNVLRVVAAILAILVVRSIDKNQEARHEKLTAQSLGGTGF